MKKSLLLIALVISFVSHSQVDSLKLKKENRFKVAVKVIKNGFLSIPNDFTEMGHSFSDDWKKTGYYALGTLGLIIVDRHTTSFLHNQIEPFIDYELPSIAINDNTNPWISGNDAYISYPIIGLYAGSIIANYEKGQTVAINSFKSLTYSIVISHLILKSIFARNRPYRKINSDDVAPDPWTKSEWDFGNFRPIKLESDAYATAFPSLHATAFFAIAKVFQMEYDNYWIPYTFMAGVFLADIKGHNHWISDLVAGGIIGTIIGKSVVKSSRKQIAKTKNKNRNKKKLTFQKQLIPQISSKQIGAHLVISF